MRLAADERKYTLAKQNNELVPLYTEPKIQDFIYWCVVANRFPHSRIADVDDLLVLKREANIGDISRAEWQELFMIYPSLDGDYDLITHNFASMRSVITIPHFHLYKLKKGYK